MHLHAGRCIADSSRSLLEEPPTKTRESHRSPRVVAASCRICKFGSSARATAIISGVPPVTQTPTLVRALAPSVMRQTMREVHRTQDQLAPRMAVWRTEAEVPGRVLFHWDEARQAASPPKTARGLSAEERRTRSERRSLLLL